jgi:GWxTD domain-containing protein
MVRGLSFLVLFLLVGGSALTAATPSKTKLSPRYDRWIKEEVVYIITDDEKKEFLALATDADRDKFIDDFWAIRNPDRRNAANSYKEEHYRRLQYANDNFGRRTNTPGWMTDMGRAWILFGKPVTRAPFLGYGQLYPCELWFYQNTSGGASLPGYFTLLFFRPEGINEYRFYRPSLDTPLKLVRGSQFNSNADVYKFLRPISGELAKAAFTLIPGDPIDTQNFTVDMTSDMLIGRVQNYANDPFNVRRIREMRSLHEKVNSYFSVEQNKPLAMSSLVLTDPTGRSWLDYGVLIDDPKFGVRAGSQLKINLSYRLTTKAGEVILEDGEERAWPAYSTAGDDGKFAPFVVAGRLPLESGAYKLDIEIANRDAQQTFKGEAEADNASSKGPTFSGPLLTTSAERVARPGAFDPFQYFGVQFHPSTRQEAAKIEPLRLLFEIAEPASMAADYQIEYVFANLEDKTDRRTLTDDVAQSEFKNGRLLKSKSISISDLQNGDYRLVVSLREKGSLQVLASANEPLRIVAEKNDLPLYFLSSTQALGRPGIAAYMRALEALSQKNDSAAADYFAQALSQNPANSFAGQSLVQLYFAQHKYTPIADLYKRLGPDAFKSSPETLAQIALSFRAGGDAAQANNVITTGLGLFPGNSTLTALRSSSR